MVTNSIKSDGLFKDSILLNITGNFNKTALFDQLTPDIEDFQKNLSVFILIGGIISFLAILIAGHQIFLHLYFFTKPNLQLFIVRILLMVPVRIIYKTKLILNINGNKIITRYTALAHGSVFAFQETQ